MARLDDRLKEELKKVINEEGDWFLYYSSRATEFRLTTSNFEKRPLITSIAESMTIQRVMAVLDKMLVMAVFAFLEKDKSMLKELREYKIKTNFLREIGSDRFMLLSILEENIDNIINAIEENKDNCDCKIYIEGLRFETINIKNTEKYAENYETDAVQDEVSMCMTQKGFEEVKRFFDN